MKQEEKKLFNEIRTQMGSDFKARQDKFAYYLMGLNTAAIGYTLNKTFDIEPNCHLIFISLALIFWLVSICLAFYWIFTQQNATVLQISELDILLGNNEKIEPTDENLKLVKVEFDKEVKIKSKKAGNAYAKMLYLFIGGILMFIVWRVFELFNF